MTDLLSSIYVQNDFKPIILNTPGIFLNIKVSDDETLAIVTVDETKGNLYSREQFENISRQIRTFATNNNSLRYRFLYLLISEDDTCIKRLLTDNVSCWRIIPSQKQLMIFETACDEFLTLRNPIENMLATKPLDVSDSDNESSSILDKEVNVKLAPVNLGIVAINIIVFIIMSIISTPGSEDISDKFALGWDLFFNKKEYYRIFTSMFVHAGIDHLYNNMIVLLVIGSYFELAVGKINYIIVYFSSGIIAGLTSMLYNMSNNDYVQSVGASGAIFGMTGGMIAVILINYFHAHSPDLMKIIFVAFLSLYGGFTSQGVDNAAHIGGIVSGFLVAFVLYSLRIKRKKYS